MEKGFKVALVIVSLVGLSSFFYLSTTKKAVSNVALANIEALAGGEDIGNYVCFETGNVDCNGHKVKVAVIGLR
jgi:hypothetical protein